MIRKEVHSRTKFAIERAEKYSKMIPKQGNVLACKATNKFLQARRIYVHYTNEFQKHFGLQLLK